MHPKHDRAYHRLFSEPALVEDLVRHFVQEPWVDHLDFTHMERINTKFHSEALERRDGDIIMRIPFLDDRRQELYLFLLLEFQSTEDRWMALRFGTYVHLLYEQLVRENRLIDGRLPPVFPLLLYNGDTAWNAATDLKALIQLPPNTPLWSYQPGMRYYLIDESRYPEGKPGSISGLVMRLENVHSTQELKSALEELSESVPIHLDSVRRALAVWINHVVVPHRGIRLEPEDIEDLDEVKVMLATRIEQWEKDIRQESRQEGRQEGQTTLLTNMLEQKFGPLPPWAQEKIALANAETIEHWAANLLTAQTLEGVFNPTN
ncbi:MAG: Rpn family recombination-promoting nuclease/putative transposase [Candidatus Thiodiazotropha sp.]